MAIRNALVGRFAEAAIDLTTSDGHTLVLVALLFDWRVVYTGKTVDLTAHGDTWDYIVPLPSGWTFTAKGYIVPASAATYPQKLFKASTLPPYIWVSGYSGSVATGTIIFKGQGLPVKGQITASMELAEQEFEIRGHGAPSIGAS